MNALFRKLRRFAQRDRRDAEVREELEFHLAEEAEDRKAIGLPDELARLAARRELGNVTVIFEDVRTGWTWPGVDRILQELRFGLRHEGARTVADLLDRRTRIGLVPADRSHASLVAERVHASPSGR